MKGEAYTANFTSNQMNATPYFNVMKATEMNDEDNLKELERKAEEIRQLNLKAEVEDTYDIDENDKDPKIKFITSSELAKKNQWGKPGCWSNTAYGQESNKDKI